MLESPVVRQFVDRDVGRPVGVDDLLQSIVGLVRGHAPPKHLVGVERVVRESVSSVDAPGGVGFFRIVVRVTKFLGARQGVVAGTVVGDVDVVGGDEGLARSKESVVGDEGVGSGQVVKFGTFLLAKRGSKIESNIE